MSAKDKAKQLYELIRYDVSILKGTEALINEVAKKCALIAVDEIIKSKELNYLFTQNQIYSMEVTSDDRWIYEEFMKYWQEVKQEIEKL